ncbi:hypothetical protein [Photobacterium sagamiensis]
MELPYDDIEFGIKSLASNVNKSRHGLIDINLFEEEKIWRQYF